MPCGCHLVCFVARFERQRVKLVRTQDWTELLGKILSWVSCRAGVGSFGRWTKLWAMRCCRFYLQRYSVNLFLTFPPSFSNRNPFTILWPPHPSLFTSHLQEFREANCLTNCLPCDTLREWNRPGPGIQCHYWGFRAHIDCLPSAQSSPLANFSMRGWHGSFSLSRHKGKQW